MFVVVIVQFSNPLSNNTNRFFNIEITIYNLFNNSNIGKYSFFNLENQINK